MVEGEDAALQRWALGELFGYIGHCGSVVVRRTAAVVEECSCGRCHCAAECCQVLSLQGKKEKTKNIVRADLRHAVHKGELETRLTVTLVKALLMMVGFASDSALDLELSTVDKELP